MDPLRGPQGRVVDRDLELEDGAPGLGRLEEPGRGDVLGREGSGSGRATRTSRSRVPPDRRPASGPSKRRTSGRCISHASFDGSAAGCSSGSPSASTGPSAKIETPRASWPRRTNSSASSSCHFGGGPLLGRTHWLSRLPLPASRRALAYSSRALAVSRLRSAISRWRCAAMTARYDCAAVSATWRRVSSRGDPGDPHLVGGLVLRGPSRGGEDRVGQRRVEGRLGSRLGDVAVEAPGGVEDHRSCVPVQQGTKHGLRLIEERLGSQDGLRRLSDSRVALGGALDGLVERHALQRGGRRRLRLGGRGPRRQERDDRDHRGKQPAQTWASPSAATGASSSAVRRTLPGARERITT